MTSGHPRPGFPFNSRWVFYYARHRLSRRLRRARLGRPLIAWMGLAVGLWFFAGGILAGLMLTAPKPPAAPATLRPPAAMLPVSAPPQATATPFLPLHPTPTPESTPVPAAASAPALHFYDIDFGDSAEQVRIEILPRDESVNHGRPLVIAFLPGKACIFGDGHACIGEYRAAAGGEVTFATVHSGVGGEGQAYRNAVEGTGFDTAGFTLERVQANLDALQGADVTVQQGDKVVKGHLAAAVRVPADLIEEYFSLPLPEALSLATASLPSAAQLTDPGQPLLAFETCGWRMAGEAWAPGVSATTGSVYVGVIQKAP